MGEAQWVVVISKPMNEELAEKGIREAGYRSYLPRYRKVLTRRVDENTGRRIKCRSGGEIVFRPLFPRYLFAELWPDQEWSPIKSAAGVMDFIWRGERPAGLPEAVIENVRELERGMQFDENARGRKRQGIIPGNIVRIEAGPYQGFLAEIVSLDEAGRVRALVSMFGRGTRATIEPEIPLAVVSA